MSLQTRLEALVSAIGADVKALNTSVGALASLTTTAKTSLVAAINEVNAKPSGGGTSVWTEQIRTTDYTNSTVTASDVFTGFAPVGGGIYLIESTLAVQSAAVATGVQVGLTTAGPVVYSAMKISAPDAQTVEYIYHSAFSVQAPTPNGITTPAILQITGMIQMGATPAAGNVRIQAKSEVAGSLITVKTGSIMSWRKLN